MHPKPKLRFNWKKALDKAHSINKKIFKRNASYRYIICRTQQLFDAYHKSNFNDSYYAVVIDDLLVFKSIPMLKRMEKDISTQQINKLIIHEMNHIFWNQHRLRDIVWIEEGFADYIAKSDHNLSRQKLKEIINKHDITNNVLYEHCYDAPENEIYKQHNYIIWANFVANLIKKYNTDTLLNMIKNYRLHKNIFKNHFDKWLRLIKDSPTK